MPQIPTLTKQEIAEHQLDSAIRLLVDEGDVIAAITLAGAAEEILGKLLEARGEKHSLQEFIEECMAFDYQLYGERWPSKMFAEMENYFRNNLKHLGDGAPLEVPSEAAIGIIERTTQNLFRLSGRYPTRIQEFWAYADSPGSA